MLVDWWRAQGLPPVEHLTHDQAATALARIDLMDGQTRPM